MGEGCVWGKGGGRGVGRSSEALQEFNIDHPKIYREGKGNCRKRNVLCSVSLGVLSVPQSAQCPSECSMSLKECSVSLKEYSVFLRVLSVPQRVACL